MSYIPQKQYMEIYESGDTKSMAVNLGNTTGNLVHNSIPGDFAFKRVNAPSGIGFNSQFEDTSFDNCFWFKADNSHKYMIELDFIVKYDSTDKHNIMCRYGYEPSNNNSLISFGTEPTGWTILNSVNDIHNITGSWDPSMLGFSGKVQRVSGKHVFQPPTTSSTIAYGFGLLSLYGTDNAGYEYFSGHTYANITTYQRHIKITKIS